MFHVHFWKASFAELAFTAILVHVVLQVTRSPKNLGAVLQTS